MVLSFPVFFEGLGLGASLIMAIGAQNAFVLKQGLLKNHVFFTALFCSLVDLLLISAGVFGLGAIVQGNKILLLSLAGFGILFLGWYAIRSLISVFKKEQLEVAPPSDSAENSFTKTTLLPLLGFSFLNPHVYLDTVLLLGGSGARHPAVLRPSFLLGATLASFIWFFGLAYGAVLLAPLFKKNTTWKILDLFVALIMMLVVVFLIQFSFGMIIAK